MCIRDRDVRETETRADADVQPRPSAHLARGEHLTEKGFEIEFAQPNKSEIPHVVAKQGEQLIFYFGGY